MKTKLLLPFLVLTSFFYAGASLADEDKISYQVCSSPSSKGSVRLKHGAEFWDIWPGKCVPSDTTFFDGSLYFADVYLTFPTGSNDIFPVQQVKINKYLRSQKEVSVKILVEMGETCATNADDPDIVYKNLTASYTMGGNSGKFTGCLSFLRWGVQP